MPEDQNDTEILALPGGMPIDYFDPDFFNRLQPRLRNTLVIDKIAFLPDVDKSFTSNMDEKLSDKKFMEKYGGSVLGQYKLVDDADLERDEDNGDGEDEDEDEDEDDEDEDGEDMVDETLADQRRELAAELSADPMIM